MNCLYITLFFNTVAGIVRTFIKSWNQLLYPRVIEVCRLPPALWTTSWRLLAPHHRRQTFSWRDISLGEETSGNRWARGPEGRADGKIHPTWIFPEARWWHARNGAARCHGAGARHVTTFPKSTLLLNSSCKKKKKCDFWASFSSIWTLPHFQRINDISLSCDFVLLCVFTGHECVLSIYF